MSGATSPGGPGPHVVVQALTHGNEVCGAIALDWLLAQAFRPARGTFTAVFANVAAYGAFDRSEPFASRCVDEDFNRLWTADVLDGPRQSVELARARELRPVYDARRLPARPAFDDRRLPAARAVRPASRRDWSSRARVGVPAHIVIDAGHAAGKRLRDYAFFDDPADPRNALLVECGQHWERAAPAVAKQATLRFLRHLRPRGPRVRRRAPGSGGRCRASGRSRSPTRSRSGAIAFAFVAPVVGPDVIRERGTLLARDGERDVRTPYDDCVLIMPTRRPKRGETAVRLGRYVRSTHALARAAASRGVVRRTAPTCPRPPSARAAR